jgi:hypothetical protein
VSHRKYESGLEARREAAESPQAVEPPGPDWTRRSFVKSVQGMGVAAGAFPSLAWAATAAAPGESPAAHSNGKQPFPRYRAVSWWLTWEDLTWPNEALMDKIRRRADRCAASGVNCCIVFGAHFRWDFMPIWGRLHDELRFVADELHQRQIVLFDHHSSVLVHRPRNREESLNIWRRNRHHVPFYPSNETAATWEYNGSRMNDWRMLDVETGQPAYMPAYNAEQFCMNNPAFRDSYGRYVKQLVRETGIDGLMSDDGVFYADWRECKCQHCQERFHKKYGHRLPPVSDTSFWGNRRSEAFADWIEMRFETCGDHLAAVQKALPPGFPFLTCCSSSDGYAMPGFGMSYQDSIKSCNLIMLEMTGSTPSVKGTWDGRLPSQLLHLGIASDYHVPCLGLGYGFFPDTAFFVWALNKFLGSDCWFSSLKGRLNAPQTELDTLADDSELVEEGYRWEQSHPHLFTGELDTDVAVFFSRATRDYYGQCPGDYTDDYQASCLELARMGVLYDVVTDIPQPGKTRRLVLSSAACLSAGERLRLARFFEGGGTVIATGPAGHYDQRARRSGRIWLEDFGIAAGLEELPRPGEFPPGKSLKQAAAIAQCHVPDTFRQRMPGGWFSAPVRPGRLLWRPERITHQGVAAAVVAVLQLARGAAIEVKGLPSTWRVRQFRDGNRLLIHAIPAQVGTIFHPTLKNQFGGERIIEKLQFKPLDGQLTLETAATFSRVLLHSPDLPALRTGSKGAGNAWRIDPSGVGRYFILECLA